ncbi:MAG: ArsC/Spx/MgsR family protein [Pseudomonadota bacterium]
MLRIYSLKTCDTCKKAIKALEGAGHDLEVVDIRADGLPREVILELIAAHGVATVLNTRSTTWRGLDEAARAGAETPDGAADLIAAHPTLMKRPAIISGGQSQIGWSKAVQAALL